jgi:hypothetical protein
MTEHEKLKSTLSAIFKRKGRDGRYTRLFENLDSQQREALLKQVPLTETELPVIGSAEAEDKWLLLTTARIVWRSGDKTETLDVKEIRDAVADLRKLVATGRRKDKMRELQVLTTNGEQRFVELEEGAPLMGVWNVLKNLGARNRSAV